MGNRIKKPYTFHSDSLDQILHLEIVSRCRTHNEHSICPPDWWRSLPALMFDRRNSSTRDIPETQHRENWYIISICYKEPMLPRLIFHKNPHSHRNLWENTISAFLPYAYANMRKIHDAILDISLYNLDYKLFHNDDNFLYEYKRGKFWTIY